jgi:hypothetical protein
MSSPRLGEFLQSSLKKWEAGIRFRAVTGQHPVMRSYGRYISGNGKMISAFLCGPTMEEEVASEGAKL